MIENGSKIGFNNGKIGSYSTGISLAQSSCTDLSYQILTGLFSLTITVEAIFVVSASTGRGGYQGSRCTKIIQSLRADNFGNVSLIGSPTILHDRVSPGINAPNVPSIATPTINASGGNINLVVNVCATSNPASFACTYYYNYTIT
jgi:hypothetical protein